MSIQEILAGAISSIFVAMFVYGIKIVKDYFVAKGGESAVKIVEIIARNAVQAVEQINSQADVKIFGEDKLAFAKSKIRDELAKYHIYFTDEQLDTFIESAVHQMNNVWKGVAHDNSK